MCSLLANDIAWALPDGYSNSLQTSSSTLAAELRTKPFFDEHLPGFRNQWELLSVIGRLKKMFDAGPVRSSRIVSLNNQLKAKLRGESVEIGENIKYDKLPSGVKYSVAVFDFKSADKKIEVLFLKDYRGGKSLSDEDRIALRERFGIRNERDYSYLDFQNFEGVWFVKPSQQGAAPVPLDANASRVQGAAPVPVAASSTSPTTGDGSGLPPSQSKEHDSMLWRTGRRASAASAGASPSLSALKASAVALLLAGFLASAVFAAAPGTNNSRLDFMPLDMESLATAGINAEEEFASWINKFVGQSNNEWVKKVYQSMIENYNFAFRTKIKKITVAQIGELMQYMRQNHPELLASFEKQTVTWLTGLVQANVKYACQDVMEAANMRHVTVAEALQQNAAECFAIARIFEAIARQSGLNAGTLICTTEGALTDEDHVVNVVHLSDGGRVFIDLPKCVANLRFVILSEEDRFAELIKSFYRNFTIQLNNGGLKVVSAEEFIGLSSKEYKGIDAKTLDSGLGDHFKRVNEIKRQQAAVDQKLNALKAEQAAMQKTAKVVKVLFIIIAGFVAVMFFARYMMSRQGRQGDSGEDGEGQDSAGTTGTKIYGENQRGNQGERPDFAESDAPSPSAVKASSAGAAPAGVSPSDPSPDTPYRMDTDGNEFININILEELVTKNGFPAKIIGSARYLSDSNGWVSLRFLTDIDIFFFYPEDCGRRYSKRAERSLASLLRNNRIDTLGYKYPFLTVKFPSGKQKSFQLWFGFITEIGSNAVEKASFLGSQPAHTLGDIDWLKVYFCLEYYLGNAQTHQENLHKFVSCKNEQDIIKLCQDIFTHDYLRLCTKVRSLDEEGKIRLIWERLGITNSDLLPEWHRRTTAMNLTETPVPGTGATATSLASLPSAELGAGGTSRDELPLLRQHEAKRSFVGQAQGRGSDLQGVVTEAEKSIIAAIQAFYARHKKELYGAYGIDIDKASRWRSPGGVFCHTPTEDIERLWLLCKKLGIKKAAKFFDIGYNDAWVVSVMAAMGLDTSGDEIDPVLSRVGEAYIEEISKDPQISGLIDTKKTRLRQGDFTETDLSRFDVVYFYYTMMAPPKGGMTNAELAAWYKHVKDKFKSKLLDPKTGLKPGAKFIVLGAPKAGEGVPDIYIHTKEDWLTEEDGFDISQEGKFTIHQLKNSAKPDKRPVPAQGAARGAGETEKPDVSRISPDDAAAKGKAWSVFMPHITKGAGYAFLTALLTALGGILAKIILSHSTPHAATVGVRMYVALSYMLSLAFFATAWVLAGHVAVYLVKRARNPSEEMSIEDELFPELKLYRGFTKVDRKMVTVQALCGHVFGGILNYFTISLLSPKFVNLINQVGLAYNVILGKVVLGDRVTWRIISGSLIVLASAVSVIAFMQGSTNPAVFEASGALRTLGIILAVTVPMIYAAQNVLTKKLFRRHKDIPNVEMTTVKFGYGLSASVQFLPAFIAYYFVFGVIGVPLIAHPLLVFGPAMIFPLAYFLRFKAIKTPDFDITHLAPILTTSVIWTVLFEGLVLHNWPARPVLFTLAAAAAVFGARLAASKEGGVKKDVVDSSRLTVDRTTKEESNPAFQMTSGDSSSAAGPQVADAGSVRDASPATNKAGGIGKVDTVRIVKINDLGEGRVEIEAMVRRFKKNIEQPVTLHGRRAPTGLITADKLASLKTGDGLLDRSVIEAFTAMPKDNIFIIDENIEHIRGFSQAAGIPCAALVENLADLPLAWWHEFMHAAFESGKFDLNYLHGFVRKHPNWKYLPDWLDQRSYYSRIRQTGETAAVLCHYALRQVQECCFHRLDEELSYRIAEPVASAVETENLGEAIRSRLEARGSACRMWEFFGNLFGHTRKDIQIELTNRCPFKCAHCLTGDKMRNCKNSQVAPERLKQLIDSLAGADEICFTGGEPFFYYNKLSNMLKGGVSDEFRSIIKYASDRVEKVVIDTCGLVIPDDEETAREFFASFPRNVIFEFSLDDEHQDNFKKYARKGLIKDTKDLAYIVKVAEKAHMAGREIRYNVRAQTDRRRDYFLKWDYMPEGAKQGCLEREYSEINPDNLVGRDRDKKPRIRISRAKLQSDAVDVFDMDEVPDRSPYTKLEPHRFIENIYPWNMLLFVSSDGLVYFDPHAGYMERPPAVSILGNIHDKPLAEVMFDGMLGRLVNFRAHPYLRYLYLAVYFRNMGDSDLASKCLAIALSSGAEYERKYAALTGGVTLKVIYYHAGEFARHFYVSAADTLRLPANSPWFDDIIPQYSRAIWECGQNKERPSSWIDSSRYEVQLEDDENAAALRLFIEKADKIPESIERTVQRIIATLKRERFISTANTMGLKTGRDGVFEFIPNTMPINMLLRFRPEGGSGYCDTALTESIGDYIDVLRDYFGAHSDTFMKVLISGLERYQNEVSGDEVKYAVAEYLRVSREKLGTPAPVGIAKQGSESEPILRELRANIVDSIERRLKNLRYRYGNPPKIRHNYDYAIYRLAESLEAANLTEESHLRGGTESAPGKNGTGMPDTWGDGPDTGNPDWTPPGAAHVPLAVSASPVGAFPSDNSAIVRAIKPLGNGDLHGADVIPNISPYELKTLKLEPDMPWRVYRVGGANIYHIEFKDMQTQDEAVKDFAHFYDTQDNSIPSGKIQKDLPRAVGCDMSAESMANYCNIAQDAGVVLTSGQRAIVEKLISLGVLSIKDNRYVAMPDIAVITCSQEAIESYDREAISDHEFNHGMYIAYPDYRHDVAAVFAQLMQSEHKAVVAALKCLSSAYNTDDQATFEREAAAYLSAGRYKVHGSLFGGGGRTIFEYIYDRELAYRLESTFTAMFDKYAELIHSSGGARVRDIRPVSIAKDKEVIAVFDVHGTILETDWIKPYLRLFKEVRKEKPPKGWIDNHVIGKAEEYITNNLSIISRDKIPADKIMERLAAIRADIWANEPTPAVRGIAELLSALKNRGIRIALVSGSPNEIILPQLKHAGILDIVPAENVFGGGRKADAAHKTEFIKSLAAENPDSTIAYFDDSDEAFPDIKDIVVCFGVAHGYEMEFAVNSDKLAKSGINYLLYCGYDWRKLDAMFDANPPARQRQKRGQAGLSDETINGKSRLFPVTDAARVQGSAAVPVVPLRGAPVQGTAEGSLAKAIVTINRNRSLRDRVFTKSEFQSHRTIPETGRPFSDRTIYSELNGLIAVGILEIVDKGLTPYSYRLTANYLRAPPEVKRKITTYLRKNLRARPKEDKLNEAVKHIRSLILIPPRARPTAAAKTLSRKLAIKLIRETRDACGGNMSDCWEHSLDLARRVFEAGGSAVVMWDGKHAWAEETDPDGYVLDSSLDNRSRYFQERLGGGEYLICKKRSSIAKKYYKGDPDEKSTRIARRNANNEKFYRERIHELQVNIKNTMTAIQDSGGLKAYRKIIAGYRSQLAAARSKLKRLSAQKEKRKENRALPPILSPSVQGKLPDVLKSVDIKELPRYLNVKLLKRDEAMLKRAYRRGVLSKGALHVLNRRQEARWGRTLDARIMTEINAFWRGMDNDRGRARRMGIPDAAKEYHSLQWHMTEMLNNAMWERAGIDPNGKIGKRLSQACPPPGSSGAFDADKFNEALTKEPDLAPYVIRLAYAGFEIEHEDLRYRANFDTDISGLGDSHEYTSLLPEALFGNGCLDYMLNAKIIDERIYREYYYRIMRTGFYLPLRELSAYRLFRAFSERHDIDYQFLIEFFLKMRQQVLSRENYFPDQAMIDYFHETLSAARSQGAISADRIWSEFRNRYLEALGSPKIEPVPALPAKDSSTNFAAVQADLSFEAQRAKEEADRIHNESLHYYYPEKFVPGFTDKTLICHIITDSIVPVEQQQMLKSAVETEIRLRAEKGEKFQERVVCLSGKNMRDPNEFIKNLQAKIAEKLKEYQALGYTDVRFDVACPDIEYDDKTTLIGRVLDSGIEVKSEDKKTRVLKGLAFKPTVEGVDTITQVEGIIMALRALDTEDFDKLKAAFVSLAHRPLSDDELTIQDLDTFIRRIPFILPATKMEDLNERKRINDLIATNIIAAA